MHSRIMFVGWMIVLFPALLMGCGKKKEDAAVPKPGEAAKKAKPGEGTDPAAQVKEPVAPKLEIKCDEAVVKKGEELVGQMKDDDFLYESKKKENARAFLCLSANHKNAKAVSAALMCLKDLYTEQGGDSSEKMDADYFALIEARLYDKEPEILKSAIAVSGNVVLMEKANQKIFDKLIDMLNSHPVPEVRYMVLDVLFSTQSTAENAKAMDGIIKALDAKEIWLVSRALARIAGVYEKHARRDEIKKKIIALLKHADPGIRGNAIKVFMSYWSERAEEPVKKEYIGLIRPLLDDAHPYVKSCAGIALATLGHKPAIHKIVTFLDDATASSFSIPIQYNGKHYVNEVYDPSNYSTVADGALYAIQIYSELTEKKLTYEPTKRADGQSTEDWIKMKAAEYRKWYEENKANYPNE